MMQTATCECHEDQYEKTAHRDTGFPAEMYIYLNLIHKAGNRHRKSGGNESEDQKINCNYAGRTNDGNCHTGIQSACLRGVIGGVETSDELTSETYTDGENPESGVALAPDTVTPYETDLNAGGEEADESQISGEEPAESSDEISEESEADGDIPDALEDASETTDPDEEELLSEETDEDISLLAAGDKWYEDYD